MVRFQSVVRVISDDDISAARPFSGELTPMWVCDSSQNVVEITEQLKVSMLQSICNSTNVGAHISQIKNIIHNLGKDAVNKCVESKKEYNVRVSTNTTTLNYNGWLLEHYVKSIDGDRTEWYYCLGDDGKIYVISLDSLGNSYVDEILPILLENFSQKPINGLISVAFGTIGALDLTKASSSFESSYLLETELNGRHHTYNFPVEDSCINKAYAHAFDGLKARLQMLVYGISFTKTKEEFDFNDQAVYEQLNEEQKSCVDEYIKVTSSSVYNVALECLEIAAQRNLTKNDIRSLIFNEFCRTAGQFALRVPENFPLPWDIFAYLGGKVQDKNSEIYQRFYSEFTKYDNYKIADLIDTIGNNLFAWCAKNKDPIAQTMAVATQIFKNLDEKDMDTLTMYLSMVAMMASEGGYEEQIEQCDTLWGMLSIYLDFGERFKRNTVNVMFSNYIYD